MSTPNPEIYGSPSTWINSKNFAGMTTPVTELIHGKRAQICGIWIDPSQPEYDNYEKGSLQWGILGSKITAQQPIDKSITAIGQGRSSAYHRLGVYANQQREGEVEPHIRSIGTATYDTDVLNFVPFDARCPTSSAVYANRAFNQRYNFKKSGEFVWYPDGAYHPGTNTMNGTFNISPFTYYESRTILLQIQVSVTDLTTAELAENPPTSPPATHSYNLETWKNDYSDHSITAAYLNMRYLNSYDTSSGNMQYRLASYGSTYQKAAFMCLDKLTIAEDGGTNTDIYHYGMYADSSNIARIVLFQVQTGLNKWDNSNELVALMPFDHVFGNTIQFGNTQVWYQIPYSDDTYEAIMEACACFGCPFTPSMAITSNSNITINQSYTDPDLCLPIILDNGVAEGDYTRGADNLDNPFIDLKTPYEYDYDPSKPPSPVDHNTYSNTTGFNSLSGGASATIKYVLDSSNVRQLLTDLWTISHNIAGADYENYDYKILDSFLVSDPINSIVSLKRFPFEIPHTFSTQKTNVCLGKNTGNAQGYVTHNVFNSVVFSGVQIFPKFGNSFLDYAPYTEYELYIPFCGTVKLNAGDILAHTLNCRLQIDLTTGACVAYIMADDLVIETASGVVSCELQVAGTDSATVDSAIQNAVINHIGARTNKEIAMLSPLTFGGLLSAVSNPVKTSGAMENANNEISRADYNLTHIQTPVHSMGNAGGLTGWIQEFNARLIIYYPEGEAIDSSSPVSSTSPHLADLTAYAHNVGFACVMNGTVSEFHGKTVGNIDTSSIVGATEEERAQIKALFAQGVWLP